MRKGLIAIFAALMLCLAAATITACGKKESDSASETVIATDSTSETTDEELQPSAGLSYKINGDEKSCTVSRGVCTDVNVVIPSVSPDGYTVTAIADSAFENCGGIMSITIPNGVTYIGAKAFADCIDLMSVKIPNSVISIGKYAFSGCSRIKSITIPNSVTSIGGDAFKGCTGLSVTIASGAKYICENAFSDCAGLVNITIPNSVTFIGNNAFSGCSGLTNITIPNSVTSIGNNAINRHRDFSLFLDSGAAFIVTPLL